MARVGACDFYHSANEPYRREKYFREVLHREHWDHAFHSLNERSSHPNYEGMRTTSQDMQRLPWKLLDKSHRVGIDEGGELLFRDKSISIRSETPSRMGQALVGEKPLRSLAASRSLRASSSLGQLPDNVENALGHGVGMPRLGRRERTGAARNQNERGFGPPSGSHNDRGPRLRTTMPSFARIFNNSHEAGFPADRDGMNAVRLNRSMGGVRSS